MLQAYLMESPPSASTAATEPARRRQRAVAALEALEAPVLAWLRACSRSFCLLDGRVRIRRPGGGSADPLRADQLAPANHALLGPSQRTWLETFWSGELARCLMQGFGVGWDQREEEQEQQEQSEQQDQREQEQQEQSEQQDQREQEQQEQSEQQDQREQEQQEQSEQQDQREQEQQEQQDQEQKLLESEHQRQLEREQRQQEEQQLEKEKEDEQKHQQQQQQANRIPPDSAARLARRRHRLFLERLAPLLGGPSGADLLRQLAYQPAQLVDYACAGRPFSHDQVLSAWQQALSVLLLFMAAAGHQDVAARVFEPAAQVPPCPRLLSVTRRLSINISSGGGGGGGGGIGSLRRLSWQWAKFAAAERRLARDSGGSGGCGGPGQPLPLDKFHRSVLLNGAEEEEKEEDAGDDDGFRGDLQ